MQSWLILCNPMDCSLPGFSVHVILQARILELAAVPFLQGIFPTQGLNSGLLCCRQILDWATREVFRDWLFRELKTKRQINLHGCGYYSSCKCDFEFCLSFFLRFLKSRWRNPSCFSSAQLKIQLLPWGQPNRLLRLEDWEEGKKFWVSVSQSPLPLVPVSSCRWTELLKHFL